MRKVAVIASHPDDEILGLGGTLRKYVENGDTVHCLILGEGITSRASKRDEGDYKLMKDLHKHVYDSGEIIGFESIKLANLPDNRFDSVNLLEIIKIVEKFLTNIKPDIVYTHYYGDLNIDHQKTFQAVLTATRPISGQEYRVKELYSFETPSATEWNFGNAFAPNVFVDVTNTFNAKLDAMACYHTELREYPHPRSLKALELIASRWGTVCGVTYAEAFMLIRKVD